jgi:transcriptional regulator with XRE-family HTH domain
MKKTRCNDVFDQLMEIVEGKPASLAEFKAELLRIALSSSLKKAREHSRKTQRQIAEFLGVQQPWVSKLESCNNDHTFESLAKYAFAIGADIDLGITFGGGVYMELASSKAPSGHRAKKYQAGHLPEFIHFVDDLDELDESLADGPRGEDWSFAKPEDGYVA